MHRINNFKLRRRKVPIGFDVHGLQLRELLSGKRIKLHDVPRRYFQRRRWHVLMHELQPRHVSGSKRGHDMRSVPSGLGSADERRCGMLDVQCGILRLLHGRNDVHFLPRVNQCRRDELRDERWLSRGQVHGRLDLRLV